MQGARECYPPGRSATMMDRRTTFSSDVYRNVCRKGRAPEHLPFRFVVRPRRFRLLTSKRLLLLRRWSGRQNVRFDVSAADGRRFFLPLDVSYAPGVGWKTPVPGGGRSPPDRHIDVVLQRDKRRLDRREKSSVIRYCLYFRRFAQTHPGSVCGGDGHSVAA